MPVKPPMLPVNDSELAMVAVAILMSSEAPYLVDTDSKSYLVSACTNLKYKVNGRSTQDDSHVDVEPYAIKLMARLLNPKSCESEKRWKARQKAANEYRILVLGKLRESEEEYNAAVEIFNTAGWKADSKTIEVVKDLIESGYGTARDIEHERVTGNDEDKIKAKLEWLRLTLRKAKAISLLAYKDDPEEVKIGQVLLSLIEQYRRKQEEDKTLKIILEIWDVL